MLVKEYGIPKEKSVAGANGICGIFTFILGSATAQPWFWGGGIVKAGGGRRRFREECWRSYSTFFLCGSACLLCLCIINVYCVCGCGILFYLWYARVFSIQLVQSTPCFFIYVGKGC